MSGAAVKAQVMEALGRMQLIAHALGVDLEHTILLNESLSVLESCVMLSAEEAAFVKERFSLGFGAAMRLETGVEAETAYYRALTLLTPKAEA